MKPFWVEFTAPYAEMKLLYTTAVCTREKAIVAYFEVRRLRHHLLEGTQITLR
jgi:hypothetical protein